MYVSTNNLLGVNESTKSSATWFSLKDIQLYLFQNANKPAVPVNLFESFEFFILLGS